MSTRPSTFDTFVGQQHIKNILQTAIESSQSSQKPLGHTLFAGKSGFGKTTLATITAQQLGARIKIITGYAISKPSELISLLNLIQEGDVLFIDEIHRLKAPVEEVLYTAMEDYCVDMIMPDGHHIRLPVAPFTLIGATTRLEALSEPLKNRFVYHFHMEPYSLQEKQAIIHRYLITNTITPADWLVNIIAQHIPGVPRQIANFCHQLFDRLTANTDPSNSQLSNDPANPELANLEPANVPALTKRHSERHSNPELSMDPSMRDDFRSRTALKKGGLTPLHQRYIAILDQANGQAIGLKTLAAKLGLNEKAIESEIEPLLFELNKIEKTNRGRILTGHLPE